MRKYLSDKEALQEVKRRLLESDTYYICCLIDCLYDEGLITELQGSSLKAWINRMLGEYATYYSWLKAYHSEFLKAIKYNPITGRLQWLDWMIEHCEDKV
jgi:hypothetical protein